MEIYIKGLIIFLLISVGASAQQPFYGTRKFVSTDGNDTIIVDGSKISSLDTTDYNTWKFYDDSDDYYYMIRESGDTAFFNMGVAPFVSLDFGLKNSGNDNYVRFRFDNQIWFNTGAGSILQYDGTTLEIGSDPVLTDSDTTSKIATQYYVDQNAGGGVSASGTPTANQIARWTDASTIEGVTKLYTSFGSDLGIGNNVFNASPAGVGQNTGFGNDVLRNANNSAGFNSGFGNAVMFELTDGTYNTGLGYNAVYTTNSGDFNTGSGAFSLNLNTTGSDNTGAGVYSLYGNTTGSNSIGLGAHSGRYATSLSNRLFINSINRTNLANDTTQSIIYGFQDSDPANQKLYINGDLVVSGSVQVDQLSASLTDGTPTDAEIDAATSLTPATAGAGYQVTIKDSDGSGSLYKVESDGTSWYYIELTQAL